eukprot:PLAT14640.1.p1 GENE.PLAT14640.1~~PLAT14640.1.p1  ORF type:complete len:834 (+),score=351.78 PLAT14640.1:26-2527(+)
MAAMDDEELQDFLTKIDAVERVVTGLKDGSVDPETVPTDVDVLVGVSEMKSSAPPSSSFRIEEIEDEELDEAAEAEKEAAAAAAAAAAAEAAAAEAAVEAAAEKERERERWWSFVDYQYPLKSEEEEKEEFRTADGELLPRPKLKRKDVLDYSVWDRWQPDDPVTLEELAAREKALDDLRNEEFEKNNPAFVEQFKADQAERRKNNERKRAEAEALKRKGNKRFGKRRYRMALAAYKQAMDVQPFMVSLLTNIAQCHLKLKQYDDAIEFSNRALRVQADSTKALWRRARAHRLSGDLPSAISDLDQLLTLDARNEDAARLVAELRVEQEGLAAEERAIERAEGSDSLKLLRDVLAMVASAVHEEQVMAVTMLPAMLNNDTSRALFRREGALESIVSWLPERRLDADSSEDDGDEDDGDEDAAVADGGSGAAATAVKLHSWHACVRVLAEAAEEERNAVMLSKRKLHVVALALLDEDAEGVSVDDHSAALQLLSAMSAFSVPRARLWDESSALRNIVPHVLSGNPTVARCSALCLSRLSASKENLSQLRWPELLPSLATVLARPPVKAGDIGTPAEVREAVAGALAMLAHDKLIRGQLARGGRAAIAALLSMLRRKSDSVAARGSAFAALANGCLDSDVLRAVVEERGLDTVLSLLAARSLPTVLLHRATALFSRIVVGDASAAEAVRSGGGLPMVVAYLTDSSTDEVVRENMARVLAVVLTTVDALAVVQKHNGVVAIVNLLQAHVKDAKLVGNLLKSLIFILSHDLARTGAILREARGIATLVDLLKETADGPVRKNVAIALAKLARDPATMPRIRELRGMEILVQLGDRLL